MGTTKKEPAVSTKYDKLTLAQKFNLIREDCSGIVKSQTNVESSYTYANINDVFKLIRPSMVKYGVDWEIVLEEASHKTPEGDPIFWKLLQGRSGKAVWLYEADLTLRWINTANPDEDFRQITLHAIGTNDGGPDKAKGSAWTYCLKYYLFEKFNIDQGEADPDKGQNSAEDALRPHSSSQSEDPGGSGQRPPSETQAQQEPRKRLTGPQMDRLYRKAEACSLSREAVDQRIRKKFGREDPSDLSREEYDAICASLDEAAKRAQDQNTGGDENAE